MAGHRVGHGTITSLRQGETSRPMLENNLLLKAYIISGYPKSATVNDVLKKLIDIAEDKRIDKILDMLQPKNNNKKQNILAVMQWCVQEYIRTNNWFNVVENLKKKVEFGELPLTTVSKLNHKTISNKIRKNEKLAQIIDSAKINRNYLPHNKTEGE